MLKEQRTIYLDIFTEDASKVAGYAAGAALSRNQGLNVTKKLKQATTKYEKDHPDIVKFSSFTVKKGVHVKGKGLTETVRDEYYYKDKLVMYRYGKEYWFDRSVIKSEDDMYYKTCIIASNTVNGETSPLLFRKEKAWAKKILKDNNGKETT